MVKSKGLKQRVQTRTDGHKIEAKEDSHEKRKMKIDSFG